MRRRLILVCREMPSPIHLRNMLTLAETEVTIFPPIPFYSRPRTLEEVIEQGVKSEVRAVC